MKAFKWSRLATVTAMALALAACSTATPKSDVDLKMLLLSDATVPPGAKVIDLSLGDDAGGDDAASSAQAKAASCDDLITITYFLRADDKAKAAGTANITLQTRDAGDSWIGGEWLFSYAKDGSKQATT